MLTESILPRLVGMDYSSFGEVESFLVLCDGSAPMEWLPPETPKSAAWCAVDLALIDAFGKHSARSPFGKAPHPLPEGFRYGGVLGFRKGWKHTAQLIAYRLLGFRDIKFKLDGHSVPEDVARVRRLGGASMTLRTDLNMAWSVEQALAVMPDLSREGICSS